MQSRTNSKREKIFISASPVQLSCAGHARAYGQMYDRQTWNEWRRQVKTRSRVFEHTFHRQEEREREKTSRALLRARKERIKRRAKGLQVFVQLARESRNRSDILLPFSCSSNQRSETTRQFRFKITRLLQYKSSTLHVDFSKIAVILAWISLINASCTLFIIFTVFKYQIKIYDTTEAAF